LWVILTQRCREDTEFAESLNLTGCFNCLRTYKKQNYLSVISALSLHLCVKKLL